MRHSVKILLCERFSNLCLASILEPLRAASALSPHGYSWTLQTVGGGVVRSSSNLKLMPDGPFDPDTACDYLVVISSYQPEQWASAIANAQLRLAAKQAKTLIGIDTGAWLLASAGLLDAKRACVHHETMDQFAERFLDVEATTGPIVHAQGGKIITCADSASANALAFDLIEKDCGKLVRFDVETMFLGQVPTPIDGRPVRMRQRSTLTNRAVELIFETLEEPLSRKALAVRLGVSEKKLNQSLNADLGQSFQALSLHIRLSKAKQYAESTDMNALEIAVRTGFCSGPNLHRAFRRHFGQGLFDRQGQGSDTISAIE